MTNEKEIIEKTLKECKYYFPIAKVEAKELLEQALAEQEKEISQLKAEKKELIEKIDILLEDVWGSIGLNWSIIKKEQLKKEKVIKG